MPGGLSGGTGRGSTAAPGVLPGGVSAPGTGSPTRGRGGSQQLGGATTKPRSQKKSRSQADEWLSLDTKLDILGIFLIIAALITLVSYLSSSPGLIVRSWLRLLYQFFGWGAYVVPVGIGAVGVWLLWRHFGDQLPPVEPLRIIGVVLAFVGLLTLVHATLVAFGPTGPVYVNPAYQDPSYPGYTETLIWDAAVACPARPQSYIDQGWVLQQAYLDSYDLARCGHGGGYLGAFFTTTISNLLGAAATFLIAIVVLVAGSMLAASLSLGDVINGIRGSIDWMRDRRSATTAPAGPSRTRPAQRPSAAQAAQPGSEQPAAASPSSGRAAGAPPPAQPAGGQPLHGRPSVVTGRGPGDAEPTAPAAGETGRSRGPAGLSGSPAHPGAPAADAGDPSVSRPIGGPQPRPGAPPSPAGPMVPPRPGSGIQRSEGSSTGAPPRPNVQPPSPGTRPGGPPGPPTGPATTTGGPAPGGSSGPPGAPTRPGAGGPGTGPLPGRSPLREARPPVPPAGDEDEEEDEQAEPNLLRPGGLPRPSRPVTPGGDGDEEPDPGAGPGGPIDLDSRLGTGGTGSIARPFGPLPPSSLRPSGPGPSVAPPSHPTGKEHMDKGEGEDDGDSDDEDRPAPAGSIPPEAAPQAKPDSEPPSARIIRELVEERKPATPQPGGDEAAAAPPDRPLSTPEPGLPQGGPNPPRPGLAPGGSGPSAAPRLPQPGPGVRPASPPPSTGGSQPPRPAPQPAPQSAPPSVPPRPAGSPARPGTPPRIEEATPPAPSWRLPTIDLLNPPAPKSISDEELRQRAEIIEQTLSSFGAPGRVVEVNHGPVITQFGVEPDYIDGRAGKRIKVKVGKISALADDLALVLAAPTIRIEAPVPGKGYVGIEVPNAEPSLVGLRDVMDTPEFRNLKAPLKLALGQDVSGQPIVADLPSMPHLLIAGTTGSGKSVCVNGIICTMLMTHTPDELKMIMVDPKRVELTNYNGIPHLMAPVVTELERIVGVLKWVQREMDDRYRRFAMVGARNITDYNARVERGQIEDAEKLPYILVIVDELADLMMLAPDETERVITRLAQMARATGIHIIISTQRPSVDVVTGLIKANFPSRIAFAVATGVDSRVILDMPGAEKLLGRGDMLFQAPDAPQPIRMQGVYVADEEIDRIVQFWREQAAERGIQPNVTRLDRLAMTGGTSMPSDGSPGVSGLPAGQQKALLSDEESDDVDDDLFDEAVELVRDMGKASISLLQRHLRIGYTRAARLIDIMEERGVIGPHEGGSKPRGVLGPDGQPIRSDFDEDDEDFDALDDEDEADE